MKVTFDPIAHAVYIYVEPGEAIHSTHNADDRVNIDYSSDNTVVGIEILDTNRPIVEVLGGQGPTDGRCA